MEQANDKWAFTKDPRRVTQAMMYAVAMAPFFLGGKYTPEQVLGAFDTMWHIVDCNQEGKELPVKMDHNESRFVSYDMCLSLKEQGVGYLTAYLIFDAYANAFHRTIGLEYGR